MSKQQGAVIIGSPCDEHAAAVARAIGDRARVSFVDAASLASGGWHWADGLHVGETGARHVPRRGWLRRLAPPDWHHGVGIGTLGGVEAQARLQLLAAAADGLAGIEWLTDYWATMRAENKLVQYQAARRIGVPVPECRVVANSLDLDGLGEAFVMKPLGLGAYTRDGVPYVVHARLVERGDPSLDGVSVAPFIAQRYVHAVRHLRIPTVGSRSWPCQLDAAGLPLDWREEDEAHTSWRASHDDSDVGALAVRVASELRLGYSSQDWIVDATATAWLVDVNPGGQWLFLPEEAASAVTSALADWLAHR